MSTSDEDTFVEDCDPEPWIQEFKKRINASISALDGVTGDGVSGKLTLKKAFAAIDALTKAVKLQNLALEYFFRKDNLFGERISEQQETLIPIIEKLNQIGDVKTEIERLNQIGDVKTTHVETSKNAMNVDQEADSVPRSLFLDHLEKVDFEKSNITIYGIPNEQFSSTYEETGNQIIRNVMNGEKVRVKSIKNIRNTRMDKDDTFRILIRFSSPYEAQKFIAKCDRNVSWSYRLGMTKLERHYSKQTVMKISKLNRNLSNDCGYKYIRSGLFSFKQEYF